MRGTCSCLTKPLWPHSLCMALQCDGVAMETIGNLSAPLGHESIERIADQDNGCSVAGIITETLHPGRLGLTHPQRCPTVSLDDQHRSALDVLPRKSFCPEADVTDEGTRADASCHLQEAPDPRVARAGKASEGYCPSVPPVDESTCPVVYPAHVETHRLGYALVKPVSVHSCQVVQAQLVMLTGSRITDAETSPSDTGTRPGGEGAGLGAAIVRPRRPADDCGCSRGMRLQWCRLHRLPVSPERGQRGADEQAEGGKREDPGAHAREQQSQQPGRHGS